MLTLALVLAASSFIMTPDPLHVEIGESVLVTVDVPGRLLWYGGYFRAENNRVADIGGSFPAQGVRGKTRVVGLRPGKTRVMLHYVSGLTIYRSRP